MSLQQKPNKTICLCAVVRDESKVIQRLIDSCRSIIDYWVIIDTGSVDNTIEIVKKGLKTVPGELYESKWVNFGHNRSELMQKAKGKADYLLLMDADMEVKTTNLFAKWKLTHNAYHLRYAGDIDFSQMLFVSGHKDWKYIGVTHEYIHSDNIGNAPILEGLTVVHHADGGHRSDKIERDIKLLEQAIIDEPNNSRSYFYLAQTYANKPDYDKAIECYIKRAQMGGWSEEVYYSLFQIAIMRQRKGDVNSAISQLHEAYTYRPTRFEALYHLGLIFREQKKYHLAKIYLEEALNMPYPHGDMLFIHKTYKDYLIDFELAICYYWMGKYDKAYSHCLKVKSNKVPKVIEDQNSENMKFIREKLGIIKKDQNDVIYCSMFTVNTPYEDEIKILQATLDKHELKYELVGVKGKGSWVKNTQIKPAVIKSVMEKYNKDVVWVDADAEVKRKPVFFDTVKGDLSYYYIQQWNEMLTGTLYIRNNERMMQFLDSWISLNASNDEPDGKNFQTLVEKEKSTLKISPLPDDYIKIFDNPLIVSNDPVIVHNQASRRFKNQVQINKAEIVKEQLLKLTNKHFSCAVIGNGPFMDDLSIEIEKSFVMRCNNFKKGYREIGERVDLNISSLHVDIIPEGKVGYPILGVLPISDTAYQGYTTAKGMHYHWLNNGQKLIDNGNLVYMYGDSESIIEVFKSVAGEINAFPTVGIMGIALARWLGFKRIVLSGFTFFNTEKSHYWTDKKTIPSSHHNVLAEKLLLLKWIENDNIEYVIDTLMNQIIYDNASINADSVK